MILGLVLILCSRSHRHHRLATASSVVLLIRISHDNNRTDAMPHTVIANTAKPPIASSLCCPKSPAPHDHSTQSKSLNLQTEPLLHIMILHNVDFERDLRVHKRLRQIGRLRSGEGVEIIFQLLLRLLVVGVDDGEVHGAPVSTVEDGSGAHVEQNNSISGAEVVMDGPLDGESRFVAEIDGDADLALGVGGGSFSGEWGGWRREARGGGADLDGGEWWQVGVRRWVLHFSGRVLIRLWLGRLTGVV